MKTTIYALVVCLCLHAPTLLAKKPPSLRRQSVSVDVFPLITNAKRNLYFTYFDELEKFRMLESVPINYSRQARNTESFFNGSWRYGLRLNFKSKISPNNQYSAVYQSDKRFRLGFSVGHIWDYVLIDKKLFMIYGWDVIGEYTTYTNRWITNSDDNSKNYRVEKIHQVMAALSPELALRYDITSYLSLELGFSTPIRWQKGWSSLRNTMHPSGSNEIFDHSYYDSKSQGLQIYFRPLLRLYYFF